MRNETNIKVPKKYHGIVESIKKVSDYHRYRVTLREGYLAENPWMISSFTRFSFARSQKEVLAFIRSARAVETVPAPAPEEPVVKEDTTNVDANNTAVPVEQDHVPSAVAVDAPEIAPDQEATAPVVDDWRLVYVVVESQHPDGYPMVNIHCVSRRYARQKFMSSTCYPIHADARDYAQAVLATLEDNATFHDCALQMLDKYAASG